MPLYEYQCDACTKRFERIQKFSDPPVETCPDCGGTVRKLLSSPAIQFKGSGWYITDYAKKSSSDDSKKPPSSTDSAVSGDSPAASTSGGSTGTASPASSSGSGSNSDS